MKTGILICDDLFRLSFINRAFRECCAAGGEPISDLREALEGMSRDSSLIGKLMRNVQEVFDSEQESFPLPFTFPDGSAGEVSCAPFSGIGGDARRFCIIACDRLPASMPSARDLTQELRRSEMSIRQSSAFLRYFSYEIRTSLNSILGYGELLQDELSGNLSLEQQYYLTSLQWGSSRLFDTVTRIYDLSRVESGEFAVAIAPFALRRALAETILLLQPLAEQKKLSLELHPMMDDLYVMADATCLSTVLTHLIDTIIKNSESATVSIGSHLHPGREKVDCIIHDGGIELPDEILRIVFQPLPIMDQVSYGGFEEIGLNLALINRYLELMDGVLDVRSRPGEGTTFTITMRTALQPLLEDLPSPAPPPEPMDGDRPVVLLVEDYEDAQVLVRTFLRDRYNVLTASDPDQAVEILRGTLPSCILMDVALQTPHGGLDLTMELRTDPRFAALPIIALTAYSMPGDREKFLDAGMSDYLAKPFRKSDLIGMLKKWIDAGM